ncbi:hypothetical protein HZ994_05560 [Akkermansiaceae bacterium]|nr:hypothetical protein HZ994_05560 [Akkermansiaceae bacterium]
MSWISKNYEKAALGGAAVVAAGLVFVGWQKYGSVAEDFSAEASGPVPGKSNPAVKEGDLVPTAKASFSLSRSWQKGDDAGRPVDLFTGVALFVNKNDKTRPLDLIDGEMVHDPIPNSWWIEHRIDPGFGDSPQRDADEDGFSNLEEYNAKTDPNDNKSYPSLLTKLSFASDESVQWVLRPGFESDGKFTFEYSDGAGRRNNIGAGNPIPKGQVFFADGAAKGRFKYLDFEKRRVLNEAIKAEVDVTFVIIEDQKPNKLGDKYEIPAMFRRGEADKFSYYDRTAVLTLAALGMAGEEFRVEENTEFSLPPGGEKKDFKVTQVTPDQITIEATGPDGQKKTYEYAKGDTGPIAE